MVLTRSWRPAPAAHPSIPRLIGATSICLCITTFGARVAPAASGTVTQSDVSRTASAGPAAAGANQQLPELNATSVSVSATAPVFNGNVRAARQAALQSAYAKAVAIGSGTEIGPLTLLKNVRALTGIVEARTAGFIKSYTVTDEKLVKSRMPAYEVSIRADVVRTAMSEPEQLGALRAFLEVIGTPKLLIVLPDVDVSDQAVTLLRDSSTVGPAVSSPAPAGTPRRAELAIAAILGRYGYSIATSDELVAGGLVTPAQLARARQGVTADAVAVAKAADADLLLTGVLRTASQRVSPLGVDFISATVEVTAKALVISNGYVIDVFQKTLTQAHTSTLAAVSAAVDAVAAEMAETLAWRVPGILAARPRVTHLFVTNIKPNTAQRLKTTLEKMEGIETARIVSPPAAPGHTVDIELNSSYVLLPDELVQHCLENIGPVQVRQADKYSLSLGLL